MKRGIRVDGGGEVRGEEGEAAGEGRQKGRRI